MPCLCLLYSRARTPKDYFYIVSGEKPSYNTGPNISLSFAITMLHNEFKDVVTRKATEFESEYADIKEKRMMRRRRDALDAKIESTEVCNVDSSALCMAYSFV